MDAHPELGSGAAVAAFGSRPYDEATANDQDEQVFVTALSRYAVTGTYLVDYPEVGGIHVNSMAVA
jgi:hypothetical protein